MMELYNSLVPVEDPNPETDYVWNPNWRRYGPEYAEFTREIERLIEHGEMCYFALSPMGRRTAYEIELGFDQAATFESRMDMWESSVRQEHWPGGDERYVGFEAIRISRLTAEGIDPDHEDYSDEEEDEDDPMNESLEYLPDWAEEVRMIAPPRHPRLILDQPLHTQIFTYRQHDDLLPTAQQEPQWEWYVSSGQHGLERWLMVYSDEETRLERGEAGERRLFYADGLYFVRNENGGIPEFCLEWIRDHYQNTYEILRTWNINVW